MFHILVGEDIGRVASLLSCLKRGKMDRSGENNLLAKMDKVPGTAYLLTQMNP